MACLSQYIASQEKFMTEFSIREFRLAGSSAVLMCQAEPKEGRRPMVSLALAAIYFAGLHLGIAGSPIRDRLVAAIGQNAYRGLFSAASLAGLIWLIVAYKYAPYFATWGAPQWWKPIAILLMLPAFVLVVLGLRTPNPTAVGMEGLAARSPEGIVRVTRHPLLIGIGLWALVHLIANGDVASFLFFGALAVTALAGTASIDAKRRRALGPAWQSFAAQTSIVPFAAIAKGRTRLKMGEITPWRWAIAIAAYALFLGGHSHIFGVSPFPG
jgi:uncharacterized membrane protein